MMHEYHTPLHRILGVNPRDTLLLDAGLAILDARRERLFPGSAAGYLHRHVARVRDQIRTRLASLYRILPHKEFLAWQAQHAATL